MPSYSAYLISQFLHVGNEVGWPRCAVQSIGWAGEVWQMEGSSFSCQLYLTGWWPETSLRSLPEDFLFLSRKGHKISQIDPPNKIKNYKLFWPHLRDDRSHSFFATFLFVQSNAHLQGGNYMGSECRERRYLELSRDLTFLLSPPPHSRK